MKAAWRICHFIFIIVVILILVLYYVVLYFIVLQYMQANLSVAALEGVTHAGNIDLDAVVIIGQLRCWVVWTSVLVALATLN